MGDQDLHDAFEDMMGLLKAMQGKRGLPQNLAQTAASIVQSGDTLIGPKNTGMNAKQVAAYYNDLRDFLRQAFEDASTAVTTVMPDERFTEIASNPAAQKAIATYKKLVEKPMAKNHALNEGIFSTALGPLDTYYPLIPVEKGVAPAGPGRRLPYRKPRNMANAFGTRFFPA